MTDILASSFGGDLIKAASTLKEGHCLVADVPCSLPGTLNLTVPNTELFIDQPISCHGSDVAINLQAYHQRVMGGALPIINGSAKAAVMVSSGADGAVLRNLRALRFNTSGSVLGAFFAFGSPTPIKNLEIIDCSALDGKGNGVRLQNVISAAVVGCVVDGTGGTSAEGMTVQLSQTVSFLSNKIRKSWVAGLLVFGQNSDIRIYENEISACYQDPGYSGNAIGLNPNGSTLNGIEVVENKIFDGQAKPTTTQMLGLHGPGSIQHGRVWRNTQWGCINASQVSVDSTNPPSLVDWLVV